MRRTRSGACLCARVCVRVCARTFLRMVHRPPGPPRLPVALDIGLAAALRATGRRREGQGKPRVLRAEAPLDFVLLGVTHLEPAPRPGAPWGGRPFLLGWWGQGEAGATWRPRRSQHISPPIHHLDVVYDVLPGAFSSFSFF